MEDWILATERFINAEVTAKMTYEQYTVLVSRLIEYLEEHPEDQQAEKELSTIKFTLTR